MSSQIWSFDPDSASIPSYANIEPYLSSLNPCCNLSPSFSTLWTYLLSNYTRLWFSLPPQWISTSLHWDSCVTRGTQVWLHWSLTPVRRTEAPIPRLFSSRTLQRLIESTTMQQDVDTKPCIVVLILAKLIMKLIVIDGNVNSHINFIDKKALAVSR